MPYAISPLKFPLSSHPAYAAVSEAIEEIAEAIDNLETLPRLDHAIFEGRKYMRNTKHAESCGYVCFDHMADVWLIRIGKRGGVKKVWKFGRIRPGGRA